MKFYKITGLLIFLIVTAFIIWEYFPKGGTLRVLEDVPVLEKPVPLEVQNYENKILGLLKKGEEIKFSDKVIEKDYAYYEIKFNGVNGFIIYEYGLVSEKTE